VTYNFDPERWLSDERRRIQIARETGGLTAEDEAAALEEAERRYASMLDRLNGTFEVSRATLRIPNPDS
jgi:hypothetical protein